jgi:thioredoxin 1
MLLINATNFQQEVLDSPIPVLVNFWAPWCGVCQFVNPIVDELAKRSDSQFKVVSVNADQNLPLANRYRLTTLPTLLVLHEGKIQQRIEGFQSRDNFNHLLEEFLQSSLAPIVAR